MRKRSNRIKIRRNWKIKPITKIVDSKKKYDRKREKNRVRKEMDDYNE